MLRTFTDLDRLETLEERYDYLKLGGRIGESTFGFDRWINQQFYRGAEWRRIRNHVIARDLGFDLGSEDTPIRGAHIIHHMNPITMEDLENASEDILDPEFLISTALRTHNAIHYGDASLLPAKPVERRPGDTILW